MWKWIPVGLLGVVGLGAVVALNRPDRNAPASSASVPPATPMRADGPVLPPEPPPPPMSELAPKAQAKNLPMPPPIEKATDREIKAYTEKLITLAKGADPETASLARDMARRVRRDAAEYHSNEHRRQMAEKHDVQVKEQETVREAMRKAHPAPEHKKTADPSRVPPPSPLQGPPVEGVQEEPKPAEKKQP